MKVATAICVICALASTVCVDAQSFSANYSNRPATMNSAGGRTASTSYRHDGSAGGIGAIIGSPDYLEKGGFALQLYEVIGLTVGASPSALNEGQTRQLFAALVLDDATRISLSPSSLLWSVDSGPIVSISPLGLATAGVVYQNASATILGIAQGFTATTPLTVQNISNDDFGLYGGDGLPDAWQVQHFGIDNPAAGPEFDASGTGQTNRFKYVAGLSPVDPNSVFRLRIERVAGSPNSKNVVFSPRLPDRLYSVEFTVNFPVGPWQVPAAINESDQGSERIVSDLNALGSRRFYRVRIQYR